MNFSAEDRGAIRNQVQRPIVYNNDLDGLIDCVIGSREYDTGLIFKIGVDDEGFFDLIGFI